MSRLRLTPAEQLAHSDRIDRREEQMRLIAEAHEARKETAS